MDQFTLWISFSGFVIGCYLVIESYIREFQTDKLYNSNEEIKYRENSCLIFNKKDGITILLNDYDTYNKEIERRENITLIVGSLILGASFLIISQVFGRTIIHADSVSAFTSIILYMIWLRGLHYSTRELDSYAYARLKSIEAIISLKYEYPFGIHSSLVKKRKWYRVLFWHILLLVLCLMWIIISWVF